VGDVVPVRAALGQVGDRLQVSRADVGQQDEGVLVHQVGAGARRAHQQLVLREVVALGGDDRHQVDGPLRVLGGELLGGGGDPLRVDGGGGGPRERGGGGAGCRGT